MTTGVQRRVAVLREANRQWRFSGIISAARSVASARAEVKLLGAPAGINHSRHRSAPVTAALHFSNFEKLLSHLGSITSALAEPARGRAARGAMANARQPGAVISYLVKGRVTLVLWWHRGSQ